MLSVSERNNFKVILLIAVQITEDHAPKFCSINALDNNIIGDLVFLVVMLSAQILVFL